MCCPLLSVCECAHLRQPSVACGRATEPNTNTAKNSHTAQQHTQTNNRTPSLPPSLTTRAHAQSYMRRRTDAVGRLRADSATPLLHATATMALHAHASKHPRHTCHHRQLTHSARAHGACSHQLVFILLGYVCRAAGCATRLGRPCFVSVGRFCQQVCMRAHACAQAPARRPRPPTLCLPTLALPCSGAQQSAALRRNPRARPRAPQIGATAYIWCVMAFLMSALMRAVLLNQYDGLCEKSGCPHESPVRPQSCTPKASSLDVH